MGAAGLAVGAQAAGGAYGIYNSFQQSGILRENAAIAERDIPLIRAAATERARQLQVSSYLTKGTQRSGYAARGLAVGGSVFDVMRDTAANFDRDTSFVLLEGELAVRAKQREAQLFRYQAKTGIRDAVVGGVLNTAATYARATMPNVGGGYRTPYAPPITKSNALFQS